MRKIVLMAVVFSFLLIRCTNNQNHGENSTKASFVDEEEEEGKLSRQDRIDLAMKQEFNLTKDPSLNRVPRERLVTADNYRKQLLQNGAGRYNAAVPGLIWQERGPNVVAGRTRALLFDLTDAGNGYKKVWAGSVGGGLWYTTDITAATPSWVKVDDFMNNLAVTAIVQNPANPLEMYVGTGEGWFNGDAIKGLGIWKSTNGGASWSQLPSTVNFSYVNDLLISSTGNLYASLRSNGGLGGIQKSTNGGASWTQVLGSPLLGASADGGDLELAANGDIYATLGNANSSGGVYLANIVVNGSANGNAGTWTDITPNSTGIITTPSNTWNRIELASAPSDANIVYGLFEAYNSDDCTDIEVYNKATNTWTVKTVPTIIDQGDNSNFTRAQAWYDLIAAVDPNNANSVYIGGVDALRSDDGGTVWTQMSTWSLFMATGFTSSQIVHADQHVIAFAPGSSSRAVWGTDGGIYYTANANIVSTSKPTYASKNTGYNVTQFYSCAISPTLSNYFLAGAQDNGSRKFTVAGLNNTSSASGGDGGFCHIDQDNNNIQITSYVYNNYYVSTNGGTSFTTRSFNDNGSFINPTDYDNTGNILYGGDNAGMYFRWNDPATAGSSTDDVTCTQFSGASITHVFVSPTINNRVFFGLDNGSVVVVDNANTGTVVTGTVIRTGTGSVSGIVVDPLNSNHMLVTYSNYGVTSIFETMNASATTPAWTAVEGNLPDMPVRWVMFDPRNSDWALIATELGVWSTDNLNGGATDWQPTNTGLANVRVDMLQYRASDRTIAAATHGRGLFTTQVPIPLPVTLLSFQGSLIQNSVQMEWSTSTEQNSKNFEVEKSTDGVNFYNIGSVNAAGNSSTRKDYSLRDDKLNSSNYYRIRMNDLDGNSKLSNVVLIKYDVKAQNVWVIKNPFINSIDLRLAKEATQIRLQLVDTKGAVVAEKMIAKPSGLIHWEMSGNIGAGSYILRMVVDGNVFVNKLIKQ